VGSSLKNVVELKAESSLMVASDSESRHEPKKEIMEKD
jgi:hypothetical protein